MAEINDIWTLRTCQYTPTQIGLNVTHWLCTAKGGTGATAAQIASTLDTAVAPSYKAASNINSSWRGVGARRQWPTLSVEGISIANAGAAAFAGAMLPTQCRTLIHWSSGTAGRTGRGRIYPAFPGGITALNADGSPTAAYIALVSAISVAYPVVLSSGAGGNTNSFALALYNRTTHIATPVTGVSIPTKWATQRRSGQFGRTNALPF
jgi:hypothetical protein